MPDVRTSILDAISQLQAKQPTSEAITGLDKSTADLEEYLETLKNKPKPIAPEPVIRPPELSLKDQVKKNFLENSQRLQNFRNAANATSPQAPAPITPQPGTSLVPAMSRSVAPVSSAGVPAIGGSGIGGPPAPLSGMLGGAAKTPWTGLGGFISPAVGLASQRDIGTSRHTQQEMEDWLNRQQTPQAAGGATPLKDQDRWSGPAPSHWLESAQMQRGPTVPAQVPMPTPRPQIPLPRPRPQITQRIPMPTSRPPQPQQQTILDVLLNSFNPNAEWRKQYR